MTILGEIAALLTGAAALVSAAANLIEKIGKRRD